MSDVLFDLRRAFDATFTVAPSGDPETVEDFLAVTVAGTRCALRVRDVTHLSIRPRIVPLPGRGPELLGLVGIRGATLPVYSLAAVTGHPPADTLPRWLVSCGAGPDVAFAFDEFERLLRVQAADVSRVGAADGRGPHIDELVRDGAAVRTVIDLGSIVRTLIEGALPAGGYRT